MDGQTLVILKLHLYMKILILILKNINIKWLDITKTSTIKIEMEDARIRDDLPIFSLISEVDDGIKENVRHSDATL